MLKDTLSSLTGHECIEMSTVEDLVSHVTSVPAVLIIASLKEKDDLLAIASFVKLIKKTSPGSLFKLTVVNYCHIPSFDKALTKLGIADVIEPTINSKGLKFKIDYWVKSLRVQTKNLPTMGSLPLWTPPLELEDDIWMIKTEQDCKKILNRWLVRLVGPAPFIGQWVEVEKGLWRLELRAAEKELYVSGLGDWFFRGEQRPEFVWKDNRWLMTGESYELFYQQREQVFSRLKCENRQLSIAKNSLFAQTKEQMIMESLNQELIFQKGAERLSKLAGEGETDHLSATMSGKSGNKSDEASGLEKPLTSLNPGQNLERERNDEEHKKYYKNHNEAEKFGTGNLQGKNQRGEKLDNFYRSNNSAPVEALEEEVKLEEMTSEAWISSYLSQRGQKVSCKLDDYYDDTMVFHTRMEGIESSTTVTLAMVLNYLNQNSKLDCDADVVSVDDDGEGNNYITVKINKSYSKTMENFMRLFEKRQSSISHFLKKVRGL